jgi:hypothetical protein
MKRRLVAEILGLAGLAVSIVSTHGRGFVWFNTYSVNSYAGAPVFYGSGSGGPLGTPIEGIYNTQLIYYFGTVTDPAGDGQLLGSFSLNAAVVSADFFEGEVNLPAAYIIPDYVSGPVTFEMLVFTGPSYDASVIRGHSAAITLPYIATGAAMPPLLDGLASFAISSACASPPPQIIQQPADQGVPAGTNAAFSVVATSEYPYFSYQWFFNGTNILWGATNSNFVVTNMQTNKAGVYSVMVISCGYTVSSNANLIMLTPPVIRIPPQSAVGYWAKSVMFDVAAEGVPTPTYQWYKDGTPLAGATNDILHLNDLSSTDAVYYWVVASNSLNSVTSSPPALLIVNPPGVSLGLHPFLTIGGAVGYTYGILSSTNLASADASSTVTNVTLTEPEQEWIDTSVDASTDPERYYRVFAVP